MKFRIIHKKLGVKSIDIFSEFEYPSNIRDICFVKEIGFLCLGDSSLFVVTPKICQEITNLDNPMSICLGTTNTVYVFCQQGIKCFNYKDKFYQTDVFSPSELEPIFRNLSKMGIKDICVSAMDEVISFAVPLLNKVYVIRKGTIHKEYGTGIPEYSLASDLSQCSLFNPRGVLVWDKNTIFVSDTDNGCIRSFGETHRIIVGKPSLNLIAPTKLLANRKKGILYYLSKNYLRSVAIDGGRDVPLYENENIRSMAMTDEDVVYVLEGEK